MGKRTRILGPPSISLGRVNRSGGWPRWETEEVQAARALRQSPDHASESARGRSVLPAQNEGAAHDLRRVRSVRRRQGDVSGLSLGSLRTMGSTRLWTNLAAELLQGWAVYELQDQQSNSAGRVRGLASGPVVSRDSGTQADRSGSYRRAVPVVEPSGASSLTQERISRVPGFMVNRPRSFEELWAKLETVSAESPLWHRLYRSLSWLERAAAEDDLDAKCVFLWVAFNAAYAIERRAEIDESGYEVYEHQRRERYFTILTRCGSPRLHGRVRTKLSDPIARLMSNEYVYKGFWDSLTDEPFDWENWRNKRRFERERDEVRRELRAPKGTNTLGMLLTSLRTPVCAAQPAYARLRHAKRFPQPETGEGRCSDSGRSRTGLPGHHDGT